MLRNITFQHRFVRRLYSPCNTCERLIWTGLLNESSKQVQSSISNYYCKAQVDRIQECYNSVMSFHSGDSEKLMNFLSRTSGGLKFAMELRQDIQKCRKKFVKEGGSFKDKISGVDLALKDWLRFFFSDDALLLQNIQFDSCSGTVLEFVARNDEVHQVKTVQDLKRRLTDSRKCFILLHPRDIENLGSHEQSNSFDSIGSRPRGESLSVNPQCAIFYSVNSPHESLTGLDLASKIIHKTAFELKRLYPSITAFSTLSPIPGFLNYLKDIGNSSAAASLEVALPQYHIHTIERLLNIKPLIDRNRAASVAFWLHRFISACVTDDNLRIVISGGVNNAKKEQKTELPLVEKKSQLSAELQLQDDLAAMSSPSYQKQQIHAFIHDARENGTVEKRSHISTSQDQNSTKTDELNPGNMSSESLKVLQVSLASLPEGQLRDIWEALREPMTWFCHNYLMNSKTSNGDPLDPVGRFHLRNGASLHRINWAADYTDELRMTQSAGMMVNYYYDLELQESRKNEYVANGCKFHINDDIMRKYS